MPDAPAPAVPTFDTFGLHGDILHGVREAGFTVPSPIQARAIPAVLAGKDLIALAQTGTGKTAAFGLPAMSRLAAAGVKRGAGLLVIVPTRELCAQVSGELYKLGHHAGLATVAVYGGSSAGRQIEALARGAQIVVATPGRLLDHLSSGRMPGFAPATVVLDEADEMLDMGFMEDIEKIFSFLPKTRQTLLFSATMPPPIAALAQRVLTNPERIDLTATATFVSDVAQRFYVIGDHERTDAIVRLLDAEAPPKALVFCRTKRETDELCTVLVGRGLSARSLHGDLDQRQRLDAIGAFKRGLIGVLVATDVAARGLDVTGISHVFNYHLPLDQEGYVHRIGRTGRAGKSGIAMTLVTPYEFRNLRRIQHAIKAQMLPGEIPSLADMERKADEKLVAELAATTVHERAVDLLARIGGEMELGEATVRLLSMLLVRRERRGPARIGLDRGQVQKLVDREDAFHSQRRGGSPAYSRGARPTYGRDQRGSGPPARFSQRPPYVRDRRDDAAGGAGDGGGGAPDKRGGAPDKRGGPPDKRGGPPDQRGDGDQARPRPRQPFQRGGGKRFPS